MFIPLLLLELLTCWLTLASAASTTSRFYQTKPGCQSKCGNVTVPYPFGISVAEDNREGCSIDDGVGYSYSCDTSYDPPKLFIGGVFEILSISETEVRLKNTIYLTSICTDDLLITSFNLFGTPFTFSHTKNRFYGIGCNNIALYNGYTKSEDNYSYASGCALSYLHSAASIPIIHRDVKSSNILLDENYTAKVSDFGASRLIPLDQTELSTLVQGTLGYLDPEYFHTSQLTEKSDVYSFGVVLLELLTGEKPISYERSIEQRSLTAYFISSMKENKLFQIVEPRVVNEGTPKQVIAVAELAKRCISLKGEERPTMKQVAAELDGLRTTETHVWVRQRKNEKETCLPSVPTNFYTEPLISYNVVYSGQCSSDTDVMASMDIPR